jgi:predicted RNase H-like HicB family nuclease
VHYPIAIEIGNETQAFGVVVPDLPGCFSAGDTLEEALANAEEAIAAWMEAELDAGRSIPLPSAMSALQGRREHKGWAWAIVHVDPARFDDTIERINITLPRRVLSKIDAAAKSAGETRSGYIAKLALTS